MIMLYDTAARVDEMAKIRVCDVRINKTPTVVPAWEGFKTQDSSLNGTDGFTFQAVCKPVPFTGNGVFQTAVVLCEAERNNCPNVG